MYSTEQLNFSATAKLTRYWSLQVGQTINLITSTTLVNGVTSPPASSASLNASLSAIYQDECMAFIGSVTQSGIRNGDVTPGADNSCPTTQPAGTKTHGRGNEHSNNTKAKDDNPGKGDGKTETDDD